ncbi:MAG: hypothetical protein ACLPX7_13085 [Xanthobacteraceae bacterium]
MVITTNYLGNVLENSLWTVIFVLVAIALLDLVSRYRSVMQWAIAAAIAGVTGYRPCVHDRRTDVFRPLAGRPGKRPRILRAVFGPARRRDALDRGPRYRAQQMLYDADGCA